MKQLILTLLLGVFTTAGVNAQEPSQGQVRNVIYLIGDGMGLAHVSMLMIEGGYAPTAFDRAQGVALISTYSANNRVTDSAAAGTALATGEKTGNGMLGVDMQGQPLRSMMMRAAEKRMPTGIVVSCFLQHATPAAFYAHVKKRDDDRAVTQDLLHSGVDVLLGGGRKWLAEECAEGGSYLDAFVRRGYRVIDSLQQADTISRGRLLGALAETHLPGAADRGDYLRRGAEKAMEILGNEARERETGFLLMIEGSLIDMASHDNDRKALLEEMRDFDRVVATAMDFADLHPGTLVVVAADHETGGVTIASNKADFTASESGLDYRFSSKSHTGTLVPVYLYGTGAETICGVMDNTELAQQLMALLGLCERK